MILLWLVVLIVCIVAEIATMGLITIWFAGGSLIGVLAAALGAPEWLQITLFIVVSAVLLFLTRPLAVRYFNRDRIRTNVESLVGRRVLVVADINNLQGTGDVTVNGLEWMARSGDDLVHIPAGTEVEILAIQGVKLVVAPVKPSETAATE